MTLVRPGRRARGLTLVDVTFAGALAVVLVGAAGAEVAGQQRDLAHARADARAQAALRAAAERLRAGALAPPAAAAPLELPRSPGDPALTVSHEDGATLDPRLAARDLVAVRLRARWTEADGRPWTRDLLVVVPGGREGR
jgi:hypothetical protein